MRRIALVLLLAACGRGADADMATGTLEMTETDAAPLQPARVVRMNVREGDTVRAGDTLAVLTQTVAVGDVGVREATVQQAQARLNELQAGSRPEDVARAGADLAAAQAEADRAARDVERLRPLAAHGTVSRQQFDAAQTAARVAARRRDAAREVAAAVRSGPRREEVEAARAQVSGAQAALRTSQSTASDLTLTAPVSGVVVGRYAEPGEVIAAGQPVVTLGDAAHPYTRVYVGERVLPRLRVGDPVDARLDGFPERVFRGRITAVNSKAEFTPRVALTERERADLLFGVRVDFLAGQPMLKAGLPITVTFPRAAAR
ncbi:HlyD family secretion protein [Longimicrobium sp.]|uniref:HlyD family secretion protein n=1 Tax=Longimicrobium sp. TaxID=2029185 RepID=UPI002CBE5023|nr:efflux RND transporter periplasmic adaptor subunit [Longimicrobium sp.]HSU15923.1 efflux RND transporter periplasmic adaptor subunit [Longimicrobium sp.]